MGPAEYLRDADGNGEPGLEKLRLSRPGGWQGTSWSERAGHSARSLTATIAAAAVDQAGRLG